MTNHSLIHGTMATGDRKKRVPTQFEFATTSRIVFGANSLSTFGPMARTFGHRALVVRGRDVRRVQALVEQLNREDMFETQFPVIGEPTVEDIVHGTQLAKDCGADLVIGFGGGSVIDAAKAIAVLAQNSADVYDYLEVVGQGHPLPKPGLPCLAIPTTAGTGAEVTRNAVLSSPEHRVKVSLRSTYLLPRVALVDPTLTYGLPPAITASTGLDALTQVIEPYLSIRANPITDGFCLEGMRRIATALPVAYARGSDTAAREDMALASLFGGLALANAGLGAVHGFAGAIGGRFSAPHGAVCAALLPQVLETNYRAVVERLPKLRSRFTEVARALTGQKNAQATDGITWLKALGEKLQVSPLRTYGVQDSDIPELVEKAAKASSMKANPLPLTESELTGILQSSL